MPSTTKLLASAAFGLSLACLAPAAGHASEVVIPAAGCTEVAFAANGGTATTARVGGGFAVTNGATASLVCAVSTDEIASSSGGDDDDDDDDSGRVTFLVSFLDSDSTPATGATVSAQLFRTTLATGDTGPVVDTAVCGPTGPLAPSPVTSGPAQARFSCPRLSENAFYHLKVSLASSAGTTAAIAGLVAQD